MKLKKVIACILAATATLSIASMGTGCGVKDWFEEKINGKDNQLCVHADVDYDNVCDDCGIATTFEEVSIVNGEKATGNWYRLYNYNCPLNMVGGNNGYIQFTDGTNDFWFNISEDFTYNQAIGLLTDTNSQEGYELDNTGIFEFHKTDGLEHELCEEEFSRYYDVYLEEGKIFTIKLLVMGGAFEDVTFILDENITVASFSLDYAYRLEVKAADTSESIKTSTSAAE